MNKQLKHFVSRVVKMYELVKSSDKFKTLKKYMRYIVAFNFISAQEEDIRQDYSHLATDTAVELRVL